MKKEKLEPFVIRISKRDRELLELKSTTDDTSMADIVRDFIKLGLSAFYPEQPQSEVLPKLKILEK